MPSWTAVLEEVRALDQSGVKGALDVVRRKYLTNLATYTQRNVFAYYSGWLHKPNQAAASIGDEDMNAFMTMMHGHKKGVGLDLMLDTPGGNITATEAIVDYLHKFFGKDIRVFIPQLAMSAGTMIACAAREIHMGKQSNLGPIDPQFQGIACHGVLEEFERAVREIKKDPARAVLWQTIIGKYHPTFLGDCENAVKWSKSMVKKWLKTGMFSADPKSETKAQKIVGKLSDHAGTKTHSRHIPIEACRKIGLNVVALETDQQLQDLVLTVHHAYMHTFAITTAIKIVENDRGGAVVQALPTPPQPFQILPQFIQS